MTAGARGRPGPPSLAVLLALAACGCASWSLSRLEPYPAAAPLVGPSGSYSLTPPSARWVRLAEREGDPIDLVLARQSHDAWLNVSVAEGRYGAVSEVLAQGRANTVGLMTTTSSREEDVMVEAPGGAVPGRLGVYCGSFDRDLRSRQSCIVLLGTVRGERAYLVVGQVESDGTGERFAELEEFVRSLSLVE